MSKIPVARRSPSVAAHSALRWVLPVGIVLLTVELVALSQVLIVRQASRGAQQVAEPVATVESRPTAAPAVEAKPTAVPIVEAPAVAPTAAAELPAPAPTPPPPTAAILPRAAPQQPVVGAPAPAPAVVAPPQAPAAAVPAPPLPAPAPQVAAADPADAVLTFYRLIGEHDFESATQLWTPRMQAAYPPAENIWRRFGQTSRISVQRANVVALDAASGRATVAVDLLEVVGSGGTPRRLVGSWYLVRAGGAWLLDQPSF